MGCACICQLGLVQGLGLKTTFTAHGRYSSSEGTPGWEISGRTGHTHHAISLRCPPWSYEAESGARGLWHCQLGGNGLGHTGVSLASLCTGLSPEPPVRHGPESSPLESRATSRASSFSWLMSALSLHPSSVLSRYTVCGSVGSPELFCNISKRLVLCRIEQKLVFPGAQSAPSGLSWSYLLTAPPHLLDCSHLTQAAAQALKMHELVSSRSLCMKGFEEKGNTVN